ncbi:hypothetical protein J7L13_03250, partial [bacterium]|nr:hypothetical protein [bacterium]
SSGNNPNSLSFSCGSVSRSLSLASPLKLKGRLREGEGGEESWFPLSRITFIIKNKGVGELEIEQIWREEREEGNSEGVQIETSSEAPVDPAGNWELQVSISSEEGGPEKKLELNKDNFLYVHF